MVNILDLEANFVHVVNERVRFASCGCVVFKLQRSLSDLSTLVTKQIPLFLSRLNEIRSCQKIASVSFRCHFGSN